MSVETRERECPCCHGANLMDGKLGVHKHTFIPKGRLMWLGYTSKGFVCLDCGFVGHYLDKADIRDLRSSQE